MSHKTLQERINDLLDLPDRKVLQLLVMPTMLTGCYGTLLHYGFKLNDESWLLFVETIQNILSDDSDIEYEFDEESYNNLLNLKKLPTFNK